MSLSWLSFPVLEYCPVSRMGARPLLLACDWNRKQGPETDARQVAEGCQVPEHFDRSEFSRGYSLTESMDKTSDYLRYSWIARFIQGRIYPAGTSWRRWPRGFEELAMSASNNVEPELKLGHIGDFGRHVRTRGKISPFRTRSGDFADSEIERLIKSTRKLL